MVLSIPPPSLADLLPAFLSHIPASFASPRPPPSLPPHLTPLTRSRLTHLAFSSSGSDSSWLSLLTWSSDPADGQALHDHLVAQDYFFLHQAPSPGTFQCRGYRRLDAETLQALVSVPEIELLVVYQFVENDVAASGAEGVIENSWKVHDIRLSDDEDVLLRAGSWHDSIDAAEESFRSSTYAPTTRFTAPLDTSFQREMAVDDDDDDDYWGRYDDEDTESTAGDHGAAPPPTTSQQQSPVQLAASLLARRVLDPQPADDNGDEDAYFAQYASVQPVLDSHPTDPPTVTTATATATKLIDRRDSLSTTHTAATDREEPTSTLSTPLTAFTHPSAHISPLQSKAATADVSALERAAEVHTQAEVAIRQHVSTSVKSLWRLWRAGGLDADDFARVVEREVEVLRLVEEAADLGR
ncbi:hypothetical protein Dda_6734 [Drechslerella dactyloides]|uniref:Uncharacterized protein n=1 Tax=Drechslerella dactyloides TaxID=74499 RepID=A0AAD6NHP0_DREDA|nr:hypothetical protein Dda_6734 [Drechslerella dactyloides]